MPADLETIDGVATYRGRLPGWHKLGKVGNFTFEDLKPLMRRGIEVVPLSTLLPADAVGPAVENVGITIQRIDGKVHYLAAVGNDYQPVQWEQVFGLAPFLEDLGWHIETFATIRDGRQGFMTLNHNGFVIDPNGAHDVLNRYLFLYGSTDGSYSNTAAWTAHRVQCANMFDAAVPGATKEYKVRHTTNAETRLADAQKAFIESQGYFDKFADEAAEMFATPQTGGEFMDVAADLFNELGTVVDQTSSKQAQTRRNNLLEKVEAIWDGTSDDINATMTNLPNSVWRGYNAIIEYLDWGRTGRGDNAETNLNLARSGFDQNVTRQKQVVHDRFMALV